MEANKRNTGARVKAAARREEGKLQAMIELGRSLTAVHDLDELLRLVVGYVTRLTDADRSTIFLLDRDTNQIWSKVAQGEGMREIRLALGRGIAGWVAATGRAVNLKNAYLDERFDPTFDQLTGYRTQNLLCAPVCGKQGDVLGVIETLNKPSGAFTIEDEQLLDALCSPVAIAIENAQLVLSVLAKNTELLETHERFARKVHELDILFQLEKEISGGNDLDQILHGLLRKAVALLDCEAGSIVLMSDHDAEMIFTAAIGSKEEAVRHLRLPKGAGVAGWVAEHGQPALVNDPAADPRHLKSLQSELDFPVRNILALPLLIGERSIGAVELLNKCSGDFASDDEKLATVIAGQAAKAIQIGLVRDESNKASRLTSIGRALSGVIHDLRTPMTIISGYVELMAAENDVAKRQEQSGIILRQFDFINDMTRELLAFARGEGTLLLNKVYTNKLLTEMEELISRELELSKVALKVEDQYGGPLRVDENKLRRLIFNLTRNARQAMPNGGEFSIRVCDAGDATCFEFKDTGPGIPEEIRGKLFQSFVTAGKKDGTGLGLAQVKKIVDEHQGRIEVENPHDGGALFRVWLPKRLEG